MRSTATAVGIGVVAAVGSAAWARHRFRDWGSTLAERSAAYPGEESIPEPADVVTRSVSIDAPPAVVWKWLVQIGQDRGGMYSYDRLENLVGLDIHSTDEIRDEWQHLAVGDRVVLVPPGRAGLADGYTLRVTAVEPDHHLVLRQSPPEHPWNAVWTFVIEGDASGPSRLISRSRSERPTGPVLVRAASGDRGDGSGHPRDDTSDAARHQGARRAAVRSNGR